MHHALPVYGRAAAVCGLSLWDFLTGHLWYPRPSRPEFGIFPLIMGSLAVTILASCIAVPLGIMTAAYLAEIAASRTRRIVKPFVELLAALPSVVIGFFGMVIVAPFLQDWFGADTGLNLLNAALMLAFMSVPTICSVAEDALLRFHAARSVAGPWRDPRETLIRVVIPSALSGIGTAVMLGMSRAIGETMVVLMVAGGAAIIPLSIFDPVRPMPASIAAEMAEAPFRGDHYFALFATGIVLFLFTLLFNMLAFRIAEKHKQTGSSGL
ncbi:MAG: phosphate ABC transporter permease subunit PstC [Bilophila wadsworthia]